MQALVISRLIKRSVLGLVKTINTSNSPQYLKTNALRCLCSSANDSLSKETVQPPQRTWKAIYYFPLINIARFINRFKLYQTLYSVLCVPVSFGGCYYDMLELKTALIITGAATFTTLSLIIMTAFFKRLIGVIFIDESKTRLRIGHLTYWGNRKDIEVPAQDIIPLTDLGTNGRDAVVKVQRYSSEEILYMSIILGKILQREDFQNVFGSFELLGLKK